jgi:hypothetical protein
MASAAKHEKAKGGKPKVGQSVADKAAESVAAVLAAYAAEPHRFEVLMVAEDVGIAKKGVEYVLKLGGASGGSLEAWADRSLLSKNGKLAVKISVGSRVLVRRIAYDGVGAAFNSFGISATRTVTNTGFIVVAPL